MRDWTPMQRISLAIAILWLLLLTFRNELRALAGYPGDVNWLDGTVITPVPMTQLTPGWWLLMLNIPVILMLIHVAGTAVRPREPGCGDRSAMLLLVLLQMGGLIVLPQHGGEDLVYAWLLGVPVIALLAVAFWQGTPTLGELTGGDV